MNFLKIQWKPRTVFAVCLGLLFLRAFPRLLHADIWAEDTIYLAESLRFGWASLFIPFGGPLHFMERGTILVVSKIFPVSLWALVITWGWTIAAAYVFSLFSGPAWQWLVDDARYRALFCFMLCFTPGLNEMLGNMANFNWIAVLYLMLLMLKHPLTDLSWRQVSLSFFIFFSIGTSVVCIPLLAWRIYLGRKNQRSVVPEYVMFAFAVCSNIAILAMRPYLAQLGDTYDPGSGIPTATEMLTQGPAAIRNTFSRSWAVRPWLGSGLASQLVDDSFLAPIGRWSFIVVLPLLWVCKKRETLHRFLPAILFSLSFYLWILPACMARSNAMNVFLNGGYWHTRYAFSLSIGATFFWFMALLSFKRKTAFIVFCSLTFLHSIDRFPIRSYGPWQDPSWFSRSRSIADRLSGRSSEPLALPTFPAGWVLRWP